MENLHLKAKSIQFDGGRSFYALFNNQEFQSINITDCLKEIEGGEALTYHIFNTRVQLKKTPSHVLAQLLINSMTSPKHQRLSFNNLTGRLFLFHPAHFKRSKKGEDNQIFQITGLEFKISQALFLQLNVRTFSSLLLKGQMDFSKRKLSNYPKYTLVHSKNALRRVNKSENVELDELYILKQTGTVENQKRNLIPFLDFSGIDEFDSSKVGMLQVFLQTIKDSLGNYFQLSLRKIESDKTVRYTDSKFLENTKIDLQLIDRIKDDESSEKIKILQDNLQQLSKGIRLSKNAKLPKIELVHNKAYYSKYELADPFIANLDVQHVTLEDFNFNSKPSIKALVMELVLKTNVSNRNINIVDWSRYEFSSPWTFGIKVEENFHFLQVNTNGDLHFETFVPDLFNQHEYDQLCDIFNENSSVEYVIKDHLGNVNCIESTEGITLPDFSYLELHLSRENAPIELNKEMAIQFVEETVSCSKANLIIEKIKSLDNWSKSSLLSCFNNRNDRKKFSSLVLSETGEVLKSYFRDSTRYDVLDSQLDIHRFTVDNAQYYYVGTKGTGIQQNMQRASRIRRIRPVQDSKHIFDNLLPLMNVDFVKKGDLTVSPFPIKLLREWVISQG
ncbi:MAG: hypothetical protein HWE24_10400 [Oceanospirillaceae bacterium]|nr:hypothetical protein [Oceanospirillaceae bacterium]